MASTETELPCPVCRYDLRGLEDGACPECGSPFRTADLKPEVPGLAIERQSAAMQSFAQKATLPFRIIVAPKRAFQHECRPSRVLTATPWNVLIWTIVWFVVLVLVSIGGRYGLDRAMGMRLAVGSYWDDIRADRFGSLWSVPVHLTIAWAECAFVALLGMAISLRWFTPRQILRLTIWLLPFTLAAAILAILCEAICDHGAALLIRHLGDRLGEYEIWRMIRWINALSQRSFDIALGLLAGIAVASVVKRRRRVIPLLTAALLAAALPILFKVDVQIRMTFYEPIFEAIYGPPEPPSRVPLAVGPTFSVGITAPSLAGTWHLEYTTGEADHTQEITIDASGAITAVEHPRNNSDESIHFVVDGQSHEINTAAMPAGRTAGYRALASCERYDEHVRINLRFECTIERTHGGVTDYMPVDSEERLTGTLSDDNTTIAGTSHYRMEAPGINFDPDHLDRAFVMRRISTASQPTTTATSREAESHNQP